MIRKSRGISLVGFLIAVAALSFVLIPLYLAFQTTRRGTVRSLNSLMGANVAASVLERYKAKTFSELEGLMLGLDIEELQNSTRFINGPFQSSPPKTSVEEVEIHRSGLVTFDADIYLSYFPRPNPNPDDPSFTEQRQRMFIRVRVKWEERFGRSGRKQHDFVLSTIVHNEKYSLKPSLKRLTSGENR